MEIPKKIYFKLRPLILPINDILSFIPEKADILDLGCGKGLLLNHLKHFKTYTGVDLNIPIKSNSINVNFVKRDCNKYLDGNLSHFNTFLLIDLLHHIKPSEQFHFVNKLLIGMKKNDILIIKDIHPKNFITKFWNAFHDLLVSKQIINYFDFNNIENRILKNTTILKKYYKRIFLYDHYFLIVKRN